jgi:hypothetical protein
LPLNARYIEHRAINPDYAVEIYICIDQAVSLEERRHEANNFNAVYGSCFRAGNFPREFAAAPEVADRYKPLANCLGPEGLPVDQGVSLN